MEETGEFRMREDGEVICRWCVEPIQRIKSLGHPTGWEHKGEAKNHFAAPQRNFTTETQRAQR